MKRIFLFFSLCAAVLCGCVNVDYVGQKLAPREDGDFVMIYPSMQEVPAELKILGRGKVVAPHGYDLDKLDDLKCKILPVFSKSNSKGALDIVESKSEEEMADTASTELADIRRHMRIQSSKIKESLQKIIPFLYFPRGIIPPSCIDIESSGIILSLSITILRK